MNYINNKTLLAVVAFSLALVGMGIIGIITENPNLDSPLHIGILLFIFTGTYLLAKNGTFIRSDEYRFTRLGISIFTIGILMLFMHWSNAREIMFIGYISIPSIYLYHMIKEKRTRWPEFLKLLLTFLIVFGRAMSLFHLRYSEECTLAAMALLVILLIDALKNKKISINQ
jgi:hypothetical protein